MIDEDQVNSSFDEQDSSVASPVALKAPNVTPETSFESLDQPDLQACKNALMAQGVSQEST